jgi:TRAP-type C4-dicarboxylate transport system permease large subunit
VLGVAPKGTSLWTVAGAAAPHVLLTLLLIVILCFFPGLALWLPGLIAR